MNLGQPIKSYRKMSGLTLAKLAQLANISESHLCLLENGQREPSLSVAKAIADALSVPLSVLVFLASKQDEVSEIGKTQHDSLAKAILEYLDNASRQQTLL